MPPFTWWRGLKARELLENYFAERVKERRGKDGNDLLTVLCQTEDEDGNRFSDEDIVNHMIFLMMAAHDTSTSTATTMAYHLAANPEWQQRCRDESDRLGDGPLDIESLEKLESLDLVMNESIRLVTPVQWAMRRTVRDTELLGYYLPAGTNVIAYPGMNHRLPELWTDPLKFDPDRFTEPRNEHKRHRYAFTPFGGGAHKCIGMMFGQLEIKTILHRLLRRYRLELPRPGLPGVLGLRRHARYRWTACRSCCARCTEQPGAGVDLQAMISRLAQAITARSADCVGSSAQPIAHSARIPLLPQMKVAVHPARSQLMEPQCLDGDPAVVEHRGESGDRPARGGRRGADVVADGDHGAEVAGLRSQPPGGPLGVGARPVPQPQRARGVTVSRDEAVPGHRVGLLA